MSPSTWMRFGNGWPPNSIGIRRGRMRRPRELASVERTSFESEGIYILTTQLVVAETVTHLRRRAGWEPSRGIGEVLLRSRVIKVVGLSSGQLDAAWLEFVRNADPKFSLCDAASIVLMREQGITRIFTFDRHFAGSGFDLVP